MSNHLRMFNIYTNVALTYGMIRKVAQVVKKPYYDEQKQVPLLVTEKVGIVLLGGMFSAVYMPICMFQDVAHLEISMKGLDLKSYHMSSQPTTFLDYILN